jgi:site-specific DNA-methyltransferase (adenine-specific)/modification methylase
MMAEKVTIGNCELWHGDCREILPTLPKVDLILTDPPYGIGYIPSQPSAIPRDAICGDDGTLNLSFLFESSEHTITWGANCYTQFLPHHGRWLCWDKRGGIEAADRMLGSPYELAWTSRKTGYDKMLRLLHGGAVNADKSGAKREHPTQKPVKLMLWCIDMYPKARTVCDPFMGSGTTGVACARMGKHFTGIERERKYFDIACRRIEQAYAQHRLFEDEKVGAGKTAVQGDLLTTNAGIQPPPIGGRLE